MNYKIQFTNQNKDEKEEKEPNQRHHNMHFLILIHPI